MIEELKILLDIIGDLTGIALWVVGFFMVFKLVVYLSTTGALVYVLKLAITKLHDAITREKKAVYSYEGDCIDEKAKIEMDSLIRESRISGLTYIHHSDIDFIRTAIKEKREREGK